MNEAAAPAIEARLEWRSEHASHVDRLLVNPPALRADGRWRAAGEEVLRGAAVTLDAAPWCQPRGQANIALERADLRLPGDLAVDRHYPRGLFGRALGSPRDLRPLRLVADAGDGTLLLDPNHPLATAQARMILGPAAAPAAPALRLEELFAGPGMQRLPAAPALTYFAPGAFDRADAASDIAFYTQPRITQHLDGRCRAELAALYGQLLQPGMRVLDLMASHDSHLPQAMTGLDVAGLGMNTEELAANPRLSERVVQDLNACAVLPWRDASFDAVLNTASIEYLVRPAAVIADVLRVLRPGGVFAVAFSDRWFPPKAIAVWPRLHAFERMGLVLSLLHDAGCFDLHTESLRGAARPADDKHIAARNFADPLFLVRGRKRD
jgi:SAM-dependent methyltransferase